MVNENEITKVVRTVQLKSATIDRKKLLEENQHLRDAIRLAMARFNRAQGAEPHMAALHYKAAEFAIANVFGKEWF